MKTFINGFVHKDFDEAEYIEQHVEIITEEDKKEYGNTLEYVGYMEFNDGSYMDVYRHTILNTLHVIEYANEEEWFGSIQTSYINKVCGL